MAAECVICFEEFKDPRILPCGHTFCFPCLKNSIINDKITCASCRNQVSVENLDSLVKNFSVISADSSSNNVTRFVANRKCFNANEATNMCDKSPKIYCKACKVYLCEKCIKTDHSSKLDSFHQTCSPNEVLDTELCKTHQLDFTLFCKLCQILVCPTCVLISHRDQQHELQTIQEAALFENSRLEQAKSILENEIKKFEEEIQVLTQRKMEREGILQKVNTFIVSASATEKIREARNIFEKHQLNLQPKIQPLPKIQIIHGNKQITSFMTICSLLKPILLNVLNVISVYDLYFW